MILPTAGRSGQVSRHIGTKIKNYKQMKILIADDHAVVREGLKQILTGVSGVTEIDGVADGNELMEKIKEKDYDVVVLDISMPGKSGLEVL